MEESQPKKSGIFWKILVWVVSLLVAGIGGHKYEAYMKDDTPYYEQKSYEALGARISAAENYSYKLEEHMEKKFDIIDGKLDKILQKLPRDGDLTKNEEKLWKRKN